MTTDFNPRFRNWVNWCNLKGLHRGKTGSAEGNWRSPQVWDDRNPIPEWIKLIDHNDAIRVNRAFVDLEDYPRRVILILFFRTHWKASWQAQKLHSRVDKLGELAHWAKAQLSEKLTNKDTCSINTTFLRSPTVLGSLSAA